MPAIAERQLHVAARAERQVYVAAVAASAVVAGRAGVVAVAIDPAHPATKQNVVRAPAKAAETEGSGDARRTAARRLEAQSLLPY